MSAKQQQNIVLRDAHLKLGNRVLWDKLTLSVRPDEFIAVLGPNGAGKTSLLKVLLGLLPLTNGSVELNGVAAHRGHGQVGYVPQQKGFDADILLRGRDLVQLGLNGYTYGLKRLSKYSLQQIDAAIGAVGASDYANLPLGMLSGGEQQRLRVAQALVAQPHVLLCDEPLLSLDLASQKNITRLIDEYCRNNHASVMFVTHDINPVLPYVDRILYLANGKWIIDTPGHVLRSKTLSDLYGTAVEVLRVRDRVLVVGTEDSVMNTPGAHHGQ